MKMEQKIKAFSAVMTGLFLVTAMTATYFYKLSSDNATIANGLSQEKTTLLVEKGALSVQLASLQNTYHEAVAENTELKGQLSASDQALLEKESQLKKLRKQSKTTQTTIEQLRAEVAEMRSLKTNLEKEISALKSENQALRAENGQLTAELTSSRKENAELLGRISDLMVASENAKLPGGLRTSAFRVEVEKRNNKLTVKGKRAKELAISFDMLDVPTNMQGVQKIYLSITDSQGSPINEKSASRVRVGMDDKMTDVMVQQSKDFNLSNTQRLSFNYQLGGKLKPGIYRATVYLQEGWIGSASFRVN